METVYSLSPFERAEFIKRFKTVSRACHANSVAKGFWPPEGRNDSEMIMLVVTELAEAVEGIRHDNPPDKHLPQFSSAEVEFADAIIRLMDQSTARGWRVAEALLAKLDFNSTRPFKHGKQF